MFRFLKFRDSSESHLVVVLFLINLLLNMSIDVHLPALLMIMHEFTISEYDAQLLVTAFLFAATLSRLVWGFMTDQFGRKAILIVSLIVTIVGLIGSACATSYTMLLLMRILQALGVGVNNIIGIIIFSDLYEGPKRARFIGYLELTFPIGFMLGPIMGAYIAQYTDSWRYCFAATALVASVLAIFAARYVPETIDQKVKHTPHSVVKAYYKMITDRHFISLTMIISMVVATFFIYIINSPFIYLEIFGLSKVTYSYYYMIPMAVSFTSMLTFRALIERFGLDLLLKISLGCVSLLPLIYSIHAFRIFDPTPQTVVAAIACQSLLTAYFIPGITGRIMDIFPHQKGMAASLLGCLRTLLACIVIAIYPYFFKPNIVTTYVGMVVFISITFLIIIANWRFIFAKKA